MLNRIQKTTLHFVKDCFLLFNTKIDIFLKLQVNCCKYFIPLPPQRFIFPVREKD